MLPPALACHKKIYEPDASPFHDFLLTSHSQPAPSLLSVSGLRAGHCTSRKLEAGMVIERSRDDRMVRVEKPEQIDHSKPIKFHLIKCPYYYVRIF